MKSKVGLGKFSTSWRYFFAVFVLIGGMLGYFSNWDNSYHNIYRLAFSILAAVTLVLSPVKEIEKLSSYVRIKLFFYSLAVLLLGYLLATIWR
ncbi:MAG: hypothetical protein WCO23_00595 [bacterium]